MFFFGWWMVVVVGIGLFMGYVPIVGFTFSVFFNPIAEEFGWNRAQVSLAFSFSLLGLSVAMPLAGRLVDRVGARRVILPSALLFGLSLASFYTLTDSLWHYYAIYVVVGIVGSGISPIPYYNVLSHWFDRRRGLALGLAMIGVGLSEIMMPAFGHALISRFGWRVAYVVIGVMVATVTFVVVSMFLKERPAEMGLSADGAVPDQGQTNEPHAPTAQGMSSREACRTATFWVMSAGLFLVALTLTGCLVHFVPMLTDRGMSPATAALATSVFGGSNLIGRVGAGYLLDRFSGPYVAATCFTAGAAGVSVLWTGGSGSVVFIAALLIGIAMGSEGDIIPYLVGRYFGLRAFGEVYGYVLSIYTVGAMLGPIIMGINYDWRGSYQVTLGVFFVITLASAVLMSQLGPYRRWETVEASMNRESESGRERVEP